MAALDEYRAMLGGEARPVDVSAIEQELTHLWKAAADDTLGGQPVVRACVLNLVAYASGEDVAGHLGEIVAAVSGRHPSRSIVIVAEPDAAGADLRASISAHCQIPPEGGKQVCSEQITLRASGSVIRELHGTVLPLLVPDLPVFLWWHDLPPPDGHLFRELIESCDRLVVDSADFPLEDAAGALAHLHHVSADADVALSDLNWSRLTQWRELTAQFFDSPNSRRYLDRVDAVDVEIASIHGREADLTEGHLLVGWLASRLGWTLDAGAHPEGIHAGAFRFAAPSGAVDVRLKPDPAHPGEGLHSLVLRAGEASFSIARQADDCAYVLVAADLPEGAGHQRVVRMEMPEEAALLCDELDMLSRDRVFEEALALAARLMEGGR